MDSKAIKTLGHRWRKFCYSGSIRRGVVLDQSGHPRIDAAFFMEALTHFAGQRVYGGFQAHNPPVGGFGEWVQIESSGRNSRKLTARHGSFMAAILCKEAGVNSSLEGNAIVLHFPEA